MAVFGRPYYLCKPHFCGYFEVAGMLVHLIPYSNAVYIKVPLLIIPCVQIIIVEAYFYDVMRNIGKGLIDRRVVGGNAVPAQYGSAVAYCRLRNGPVSYVFFEILHSLGCPGNVESLSFGELACVKFERRGRAHGQVQYILISRVHCTVRVYVGINDKNYASLGVHTYRIPDAGQRDLVSFIGLRHVPVLIVEYISPVRMRFYRVIFAAFGNKLLNKACVAVSGKEHRKVIKVYLSVTVYVRFNVIVL